MKPWILTIGVLLLCISAYKYPNTVKKVSIDEPSYLNINKDIILTRNAEIQDSLKTELPKPVIKGKTQKIEPKWINIRVSYYTISRQCTTNLHGITASGKNLKTLSRGGSGINNITYIAVPKDIPFGTKFYIEGIGLCEAVDRGNAIKWSGDTMKVDVFVPNATDKELMKKGILNTKGYIIKDNSNLSIDN